MLRRCFVPRQSSQRSDRRIGRWPLGGPLQPLSGQSGTLQRNRQGVRRQPASRRVAALEVDCHESTAPRSCDPDRPKLPLRGLLRLSLESCHSGCEYLNPGYEYLNPVCRWLRSRAKWWMRGKWSTALRKRAVCCRNTPTCVEMMADGRKFARLSASERPLASRVSIDRRSRLGRKSEFQFPFCGP